MSLREALAQAVRNALGNDFQAQRLEHGLSGAINRTAVLHGDHGQRYFIKLNRIDRLTMFEAEAEGLEEIRRSASIHAPQPICHGHHEDQAYLILEYLELQSGDRTHEQLARQLAIMHRMQKPTHGWHRDNTVGSTPQSNAWNASWTEFFAERRLRPQLLLAQSNGVTSLQHLGESLLETLPDFFTDYHPVASLLHGDLWNGNIGATAEEPVVFDPAVYYGDREADIAMTELFGGFSARFYAAYADAWALDAGYRNRKTLYNLYHVLNHLNLFGGGYESQARRMMQQLLSETR
jgi:protein-ribulosamine 3-kinase